LHNYTFHKTDTGYELVGFPDMVKVLAISEADAGGLIDLALHDVDLQRARAYLYAMATPQWTDPIVREGLWHSAVVRFMKCYGEGVRSRLDHRVIHAEAGARGAFAYTDSLRDNHVAHDVNSFAQVRTAAVLNKRG
jgi:hypothetical protein